MNVLLDEPKAHKSFRDMDISLDSEFLVSTSTDGSARIWKIDEGAPLVNLTRSSDEKIECCRFSRDGMKPFLFCTVAKGSKVVTVVWNISDWKRIGYKRLLGKPISTLSVSLDGKYLALWVDKCFYCYTVLLLFSPFTIYQPVRMHWKVLAGWESALAGWFSHCLCWIAWLEAALRLAPQPFGWT